MDENEERPEVTRRNLLSIFVGEMINVTDDTPRTYGVFDKKGKN